MAVFSCTVVLTNSKEMPLVLMLVCVLCTARYEGGLKDSGSCPVTLPLPPPVWRVL